MQYFPEFFENESHWLIQEKTPIKITDNPNLETIYRHFNKIYTLGKQYKSDNSSGRYSLIKIFENGATFEQLYEIMKYIHEEFTLYLTPISIFLMFEYCLTTKDIWSKVRKMVFANKSVSGNGYRFSYIYEDNEGKEGDFKENSLLVFDGSKHIMFRIYGKLMGNPIETIYPTEYLEKIEKKEKFPEEKKMHMLISKITIEVPPSDLIFIKGYEKASEKKREIEDENELVEENSRKIMMSMKRKPPGEYEQLPSKILNKENNVRRIIVPYSSRFEKSMENKDFGEKYQEILEELNNVELTFVTKEFSKETTELFNGIVEDIHKIGEAIKNYSEKWNNLEVPVEFEDEKKAIIVRLDGEKRNVLRKIRIFIFELGNFISHGEENEMITYFNKNHQLINSSVEKVLQLEQEKLLKLNSEMKRYENQKSEIGNIPNKILETKEMSEMFRESKETGKMVEELVNSQEQTRQNIQKLLSFFENSEMNGEKQKKIIELAELLQREQGKVNEMKEKTMNQAEIIVQLKEEIEKLEKRGITITEATLKKTIEKAMDEYLAFMFGEAKLGIKMFEELSLKNMLPEGKSEIYANKFVKKYMVGLEHFHEVIETWSSGDKKFKDELTEYYDKIKDTLIPKDIQVIKKLEKGSKYFWGDLER